MKQLDTIERDLTLKAVYRMSFSDTELRHLRFKNLPALEMLSKIQERSPYLIWCEDMRELNCIRQKLYRASWIKNVILHTKICHETTTLWCWIGRRGVKRHLRPKARYMDLVRGTLAVRNAL